MLHRVAGTARRCRHRGWDGVEQGGGVNCGVADYGGCLLWEGGLLINGGGGVTRTNDGDGLRDTVCLRRHEATQWLDPTHFRIYPPLGLWPSNLEYIRNMDSNMEYLKREDPRKKSV